MVKGCGKNPVGPIGNTNLDMITIINRRATPSRTSPESTRSLSSVEEPGNLMNGSHGPGMTIWDYRMVSQQAQSEGINITDVGPIDALKPKTQDNEERTHKLFFPSPRSTITITTGDG